MTEIEDLRAANKRLRQGNSAMGQQNKRLREVLQVIADSTDRTSYELQALAKKVLKEVA